MVVLKLWQENKIRAVLNVFETAKADTNYQDVFVYADGLNRRKQVTLGRGFTEDGGSLKKVIELYLEYSYGKYKEELGWYVNKIGQGVLWSNENFKRLLKNCGENDISFKRCQDLVYDLAYWDKMILYNNEKVGAVLPLTIMILQDSQLHGSIDLVRKLFKEVPPKDGGDEKEWAAAYCKARRKWWLEHPNNPFRGVEGKGTYRMDTMLDCIRRGNWELNLPIAANGVKI